MQKIKEFFTRLFPDGRAPADRQATPPGTAQPVSLDRLLNGTSSSALSREHGEALSGRTFGVDECGIRWFKV